MIAVFSCRVVGVSDKEIMAIMIIYEFPFLHFILVLSLEVCRLSAIWSLNFICTLLEASSYLDIVFRVIFLIEFLQYKMFRLPRIDPADQKWMIFFL